MSAPDLDAIIKKRLPRADLAHMAKNKFARKGFGRLNSHRFEKDFEASKPITQGVL